MPPTSDLAYGTMVLTYADVQSAHDRVRGIVKKTPLITSELIDEMCGCHVYFKSEHLQSTGSFKARGACNAVSVLQEDPHVKGVLTHSSGNHGQGLAWAAKKARLPCTVVVPKNAPPSKAAAMQTYGANIVFCEPTMKSRQDTCMQLAEELRYGIVLPFNDPLVMAGQGTIGIELVDQLPDLSAVFLAIGGGGLASGILTVINELKKDAKVYLVEPIGKSLDVQLDGGQREGDDSLSTVADGVRVADIGSHCRSAIQGKNAEIVSVTDEEILDALEIIWTRTKQRVEPTAGMPLAGLLKKKGAFKEDDKVALILCGGNCDVDMCIKK